MRLGFNKSGDIKQFKIFSVEYFKYPKMTFYYLEIAIFIKGYTLVSDIGTVSCVFQLNLKFTQTSSASTTRITATLKILLDNEP